MEFMYEKKDALTNEQCDNFISVYNNNKTSHYDGVTYFGLNPDIKKTRDLMMRIDDDKYKDVINNINDNLMIGLNEYYDILHKNKNYDDGFKVIFNGLYLERSILIQRYEKNMGKFIYHNDWSHSKKDKSQRMLTFIYYLNTVEEGGETEFFGGSKKIKPEKGKLILFPSTWTYPHKGNIPISSEKYIITGWLYEHYEDPNIMVINENIIKKYKNDIIFSTNFYSLFTQSVCEWIISKNDSKEDITKITQTHPLFVFIIGNIQSIIYKLKDIYKIPDGINIDIQEIFIIKDTNISYNSLFYSRIPLSEPIKNFNKGYCIFSTQNIIIEDRKGIDLFILFNLKGYIKRENTIIEINI